jgi:hypothetical protein
MLYLSYLVMGLFLLHFVMVSFWNKVQVVGNEMPGPHELFLPQVVTKRPVVPEVHGTPMTCEAAHFPLG